MSVLIKGGRIVTASDDYAADVFIKDQTISVIGDTLELAADKVIDAAGKYVIPGCIDPHTHLDSHYEGLTTCDDFTTGTVAAAFGGTTCIVDFCTQYPGQTLREALAVWKGKLDRAPPVIDVGFHMTVTDLGVANAYEDLAWLCDEGVTSFKLYMAYKGSIMVDDATLFRTMLAAAETGALVLVHAENGDVIDVLVRKAVLEGKTEPRWHALTRPPLTEAEATSRAIQLARAAGASVYVVHVSCREALEPIALARAHGWQAWGETCTQYLVIDETALDEPDFGGAKYVFTPPPRPKEHQEELWRALTTDVLSVVSSDHCPYYFKTDKAAGRDDFSRIPQGAPGIEDRLLMLHDQGVRRGRLTMNRLVELLSTNPARLFGLYPRKGTIAVGSDADIVVFDPSRRVRISARTHHSRVDYNLFEGREVVGAPDTVLVRGQVVVENGQLAGRPGHGKYVRRARFGSTLMTAALSAFG